MPFMQIPRLSRLNPHRPPDARYQRALELFQSQGHIHDYHDDEPTQSILRFLRERQKATTPDQEYELITDDALVMAFHLRETVRPQTRWLLEARLLAGEQPERIGTKMGVRESAIEWYAYTFFDVDRRLPCRDFILLEVIGTPQKLDEAGYAEYRWKSLGYLYGVEALEECIRATSPAAASMYAGSGSPWRANHWYAILEQKAVTALQTLDPTNEETARELVKLFARVEASRSRLPDQGRSKAPSHIVPERPRSPYEGFLL
jgi:hypothetical protein